MWHLFGPIVRWPLHSPRRLLGVVAVTIAAVMLLGELNDAGTQPDDAAAGSATAVATGDTAGGDGPPPTADSSAQPADGVADEVPGGTDAFSPDPAAGDPGVAAQQAAAEFVAAWARPDLDPATWQAGLAPLAAPQLRDALADTDPANVPAVTVSGPPVRVAANAEAGVFDVPTTGEFVRVSVQLIDGAWLATEIQPTT